MTYELWDTARRNQIGTFTSKEAAFRAVCSITRAHPDLVDDLVLDAEDAQGEEVFMVAGAELLDLASHEYA